MLRARSTVIHEIPAEAPSERNRFKRLDPSVRSAGLRVAKALTCKGMKTRPMPSPCNNPLTITCISSTASDQCAICHSEKAQITKPLATTGRASIPRRIIRPDSCIEIRIPTPRGIKTIPVSITP